MKSGGGGGCGAGDFGAGGVNGMPRSLGATETTGVSGPVEPGRPDTPTGRIGSTLAILGREVGGEWLPAGLRPCISWRSRSGSLDVFLVPTRDSTDGVLDQRDLITYLH